MCTGVLTKIFRPLQCAIRYRDPPVTLEPDQRYLRRDPDSILPEKIEAALFTALDNENDAAIAAQLQATLQTLLRAGARAAPSYWLTVCSGVALAAPPPPPLAAEQPSGEPHWQQSPQHHSTLLLLCVCNVLLVPGGRGWDGQLTNLADTQYAVRQFLLHEILKKSDELGLRMCNSGATRHALVRYVRRG